MQTLFLEISFLTSFKGWLLALIVFFLSKKAYSCDYIDNKMLETILLRH